MAFVSFSFFLSFFLFILLGGLRCQGARKCQKHSGIDTGPPSSRLFANSRMRAWRCFKCRLPLKGLAAKMPRCLHEAALDAVAGHLLRGPRQSAERPCARQVKSASQCVQLRRSQRVMCKTHERVPASNSYGPVNPLQGEKSPSPEKKPQEVSFSSIFGKQKKK